MKHYTGVGSRSTPGEVMEIMQDIAYKLAKDGYTLRSGSAAGADTAFERGVVKYFKDNCDSFPAPAHLAQIYIPWKGFADIEEGYKDWYHVLSDQKTKHQAEEMASEIHPAWERCSRGAKALHARNIYQVLGVRLDTPSKFLICWAPTNKDGRPTGGTRTAWMLGEKYIGIDKCFNLFIEEHRKRIEGWL